MGRETKRLNSLRPRESSWPWEMRTWSKPNKEWEQEAMEITKTLTLRHQEVLPLPLLMAEELREGKI